MLDPYSLLTDADALALADASGDALAALSEAARARRDRAWGRTLTWSPKVFLPLTNICRDRCSYCAFRRSPGEPGAWTMSPDEVIAWLDRAREQGCAEALLCLGDKPDVFPDYRAELARWGMEDTTDYLVWAGEQALARGLLPHTNAGLLDRDQLTRLREVNVSLGLMLESVSERLCERGGPHWRAPDKRPERRVAMTREAGELRIPFTSGVLIGIGETPRERVETLLAIRALHREGGHVQEVIVQNFRAGASTGMANSPEPDAAAIARTVSLARLILPDEVSVQAPPNLNPSALHGLIDAGINDFGGISPVSPDYINPGHPWPHLERLAARCAERGFALAPRLAVYDRYADDPRWQHDALLPAIARVRARLNQAPSPQPPARPGAP